jgi:hypothetical protein
MQRRDVLKTTGVAATGVFGLGLYTTTREESDGGQTAQGQSGDNQTTQGQTANDRTPDAGHGTSENPADQTIDVNEYTETPTDEMESPFETVVDVVAEGGDQTGEEPVNWVFEEYAGHRTLLEFGTGTYKIDYFTLQELTQFGIRGTGDEPATFVPADGNCRGGHPWVFFDRIQDLHLQNLVFDFREAATGGPLHYVLGGESTVRDVTHLGSCSNQIGMVRVEVKDENGSAQFENVVARNVDENNSLTAVYVGDDHSGELTFRDCTMERFSDNGLYASAPGSSGGGDGAVHVVGGTYTNNNVAGVRLGSTGSSADGVTVRVDGEVPGWGGLNARGIRLRNKSGQVIEGCDITFGPDAAESFGGIVFHRANGGALVRDTSITIHRDSVPAVRAFHVEQTTDSALVFENCSMTGDAATGVTARIEGRDGTVFRNCTIEQTGRNRQGLYFLDSTDCRIVNSRIDVGTAPVTVENGTVTIENTTIVTADGERQVESVVLEDGTIGTESDGGVDGSSQVILSANGS